MKPPICKLCKSPHWLDEEHKDTETEVPAYVKEMAKGAMGRETITQSYEPPVIATINRTEKNNRTNKRTRGRPKKWASEAERQRAYRERSK